MTAPAIMTEHPSDQTLASFADHQLGPEERAAVVKHISDCGECLSIVQTAQDFNQREGGSVVQFAPRRPLTALAVAAMIALAVISLPQVREWITAQRTGELSTLVKAQDKLSERRVESRLSGGFKHHALKRTMRSGDTESAIDPKTWQVHEVAATLDEKKNKSWKELRTLGLAHLLLDEPDRAISIDKAIEALEQADSLSRHAEPTLTNDLAAAYLERARFRGEKKDAARGLELAQRAWQLAKTPESAWNRALAFELNERKVEAKRAWQDYLALDSTSPWAKEARGHLNEDL